MLEAVIHRICCRNSLILKAWLKNFWRCEQKLYFAFLHNSWPLIRVKLEVNLVRGYLFLLRSELLLKIFAFVLRNLSENLQLRGCLKVYSLEYKSQSVRIRYDSFRICFEQDSKWTRFARQGRFKVPWLNVTHSRSLVWWDEFCFQILINLFSKWPELSCSMGGWHLISLNLNPGG